MPPPELSRFLCHDLLKGGVIAVSPILYFTAESMSCLLNTSDVSTCQITVLSCGYLSLYFVFYAFYGVAQASVSLEVRKTREFIQRQIRIVELANLEMDFDKSVRVFLWTTTAVLNIYLFSHMRSKNAFKAMEIEVIGAVAVLTMTMLTVIETVSLFKIQGALVLPEWVLRLVKKMRVKDDEEKCSDDDDGDDEESGGNQRSSSLMASAAPAQAPDSEAPVLIDRVKFPIILGLFVLTMLSPALCSLYGITLDRRYLIYNRITFSITSVLFLLSR